MNMLPRRAVVLAVGLAVGGLLWLGLAKLVSPPPLPRADHPDQPHTGDPPHAPPVRATITNSIGMTLLRIEPGQFMMGPLPEPDDPDTADSQRQVRIDRPFLLGVHEVTQAQWQQVMDVNPSRFTGNYFPVEQVTWTEALTFCRKLSEREGRRYRLPTEAEWEYACRAGTTTHFSFGDRDEDLHRNANYCDSSNREGFPWIDKAHDDGYPYTAPVGSYPPNPWGLHDMHGNVMEWTQDAPADAAADPAAPSRSGFRTLRGGAWADNPARCRAAHGLRSAPDSRSDLFGLRILRELPD